MLTSSDLLHYGNWRLTFSTCCNDFNTLSFCKSIPCSVFPWGMECSGHQSPLFASDDPLPTHQGKFEVCHCFWTLILVENLGYKLLPFIFIISSLFFFMYIIDYPFFFIGTKRSCMCLPLLDSGALFLLNLSDQLSNFKRFCFSNFTTKSNSF